MTEYVDWKTGKPIQIKGKLEEYLAGGKIVLKKRPPIAIEVSTD